MRTLVLTLILAVAGCGQPAEQSTTAQTAMTDMATTTSAPAGPVAAQGTVTALNAAGHTITLSHEPIAAINWPAMTMTFSVENPALLNGVTVGDHVAFQLKSAREPGVIVALAKQ